MRTRFDELRRLRTVVAIAITLSLGACATPRAGSERNVVPLTPGSVLRASTLTRALEDDILAIDPEHVSDTEVRQTLALGPTPRIMSIHGGIYPVHLVMESFAEFLVRMGYPESAVRDPGSHDLTHSPYEEARVLAGEVAWYYEHEGVRPMLVGHSQGGMQAVKVLYELSGTFDDRVVMFNPLTHREEDRTTFLDPLTGVVRPITSLKLPYVSSVGAGGLTNLLPNQWIMVERTFEIPDSVEDFTGFQLGVDLIALDSSRTRGRYRAIGSANVRNVHLPAAYSHYYVANVEPLADDANTRDWLNAWTPALTGQDPPAGINPENIQWAADVWYSIKEHWVREAQRFVRARRALEAR
jgi:hypothetical protein